MVSNTGVPADLRMLATVCERFGLGTPSRITSIAEGLMNRNWRVDIEGGSIAVKEILDVDATQAAFQHRVTVVLAAEGFPVPAPLAMADGQTLLHLDERLFAAAPWAEGRHVSGVSWSLAQCREVGQLLGRIHLGLAKVLPEGVGPIDHPIPEAITAKADIGRFQALIDEREQPDDFDRFVRVQLDTRRELLENVAHLRPNDGSELEPAGYVHGDFHGLNLLWDRDGHIAAVLDWDRVGRRRAYAYELARSATLIFGSSGVLDVDRVAVFVAGYRSVVHIRDEQILRAVRCLWWDWVCGLWQLDWHYVRRNTSCDHLFASSCALLAWWSAHLDVVERTLTGR